MVLYARLDRSAVEGLARRFGISDITAFSVIDGGYVRTPAISLKRVRNGTF